MRRSVYTTQREYPLSEGETLLSTTDLKGRIVYANDAFIRVSGFERGELYGKAHNIVRHPDMPQAAFADMWDTVQQGLPWSALVKNRRKNGDHYWVRANASPIRRSGEVVGYLSVRTKPAAEEVAQNEALYRQLQAGASHLGLQRGFVVGRGLWRSLQARWRARSLGMRLQGKLLCLGAAGAMACLAVAQAPQAWLLPVLMLWLLSTTLIMWRLQAEVVAPLCAVLVQARAVASGQLAQPQQSERMDEIGELMRSVQQAGLNLNSLVGDIQGKAGRVHACAEELQQGHSHLSARTEAAAASLEQAAQAMEQLTAAIQSNSEKAGHAADSAGRSVQSASDGAVVVAQLVQTMQGVTRASQRVSEISALIDSIAFQTNLLALNAAVEAARAGEHGKGFAVVAAEVRALSQKSAQAARDIKAVVDESQNQVLTGFRVAEQAGGTMRGVVASMQGLAGLVHDIRLASQEQAAGMEQINQAVGQLEQMTQQNAELVRQGAQLTETLALQAARLDEAASVFQG